MMIQIFQNSRRIIAAGLFVVVIGGGGGYVYYSFNGNPENILRTMCVAKLKTKLKSPSSFRLVKWYPLSVEPYSADDYDSDHPKKTFLDKGIQKTYNEFITSSRRLYVDVMHEGITVSLRYEAANSYNTPIAELAGCRVILEAGDRDFSNLSPSQIDIY